MRRRGKKGNAARERALAEMASARKGGSRRTSQYEVQSEGDVCDLVDEKQYAKLVEDRRKRGDFVVDDDASTAAAVAATAAAAPLPKTLAAYYDVHVAVSKDNDCSCC